MTENPEEEHFFELTPEEVLDRCERGSFDGLIGAIETERVDFKGGIYALSTDAGRHELAKDVAAFANAEGGVLILGVKAAKSEYVPSDEAVKLRPVPRDKVDVDQHRELISSWVFPPPEGVQIRWFSSEDASKGYLAIRVAPPRVSRRPFLVVKSIEKNGKVSGVTYCYYRRMGAHVVPVSPHEVQGLMRDGLALQIALDARGGLARAPVEEQPPPLTETLPSRIEELTETCRLHESPVYCLAATPQPAVHLNGLFEAPDADLVKVLREPPSIRRMGFGLNTFANPEIIRGERRQAVNPEGKGLALWRDGTLVFVGPGGQDFLSWADKPPEDPYTINPVVLLESAYLFCVLAREVYEKSGEQIASVKFTLAMKRMGVDDKPPLIRTESKEAPDCHANVTVDVEAGFEPDQAAFRLVSELYVWFGLERSYVPYVDRTGDPRIDPDQINAF